MEKALHSAFSCIAFLPGTLSHGVVAIPVPLGVLYGSRTGVGVAGPADGHVHVPFQSRTGVHIVGACIFGIGINQLGVGQTHEGRICTVTEVAGHAEQRVVVAFNLHGAAASGAAVDGVAVCLGVDTDAVALRTGAYTEVVNVAGGAEQVIGSVMRLIAGSLDNITAVRGGVDKVGLVAVF